MVLVPIVSILNSLWVSNPQLSSFWLDALASCLGHFLCSVYSGTLSYGYLAIWPPCNMASKGGAVVRALASHQCGLGSIPGPSVICGLSLLLVLSLMCTGEEGWCSGESARLPPMWPGFDSRTRCHMWVEFVVGSLLDVYWGAGVAQW